MIALAAALALAVLQAARGAWVRASRRRLILARVARAGVGEAEAAALLEARGYAIVGAQVAATYAVRVDDEETLAGVRADYVVRKGGLTFVVEVKTGAVAPRIATTATRRQLLEYRVAFDVDGVLLLDAEAGRLQAVTFPRLGARAADGATRAAGSTFGWGEGLVAAGLVAAAALAAAALDLVSRSTP